MLWLRKLAAGRASSTPAARCWASRRPSAPTPPCWRSPGTPSSRSTCCRPIAIFVCLYFFATRALFYFTLLLRDKLEYAEKVLILRWEIISYLLTLSRRSSWSPRCTRCRPVGWVAVALALGVLGALTRRILEEAIGAEDLNKVHLMEVAIASNATLQGSFDQIERLAYRLLDWGDFRIYRVVGRRAHAGLSRHARAARPRRAARAAPPRSAPRRSAPGGSSMVKDARSDPRVADADAPTSGASSSIRSGSATSCSGTVEVDHPKRHTYGSKDLTALEHAGQPDRDGDPHRRAAPAAARHGRADRRSR